MYIPHPRPSKKPRIMMKNTIAVQVSNSNFSWGMHAAVTVYIVNSMNPHSSFVCHYNSTLSLSLVYMWNYIQMWERDLRRQCKRMIVKSMDIIWYMYQYNCALGQSLYDSNHSLINHTIFNSYRKNKNKWYQHYLNTCSRYTNSIIKNGIVFIIRIWWGYK